MSVPSVSKESPFASILAETAKAFAQGLNINELQDNNKKNTQETIQAINQAIQNGTLKTYLDSVDADDLMLKLSGDWSHAPYLEILKVCDARIAMPLLSGITAGNILSNYRCVHMATNALEIFNAPDRLPVFIQALKLGRTKYWNTIGIDDLVLRHNNADPLNPFHQQVPPLVYKALKIESGHRPSFVQQYASAFTQRKEGEFLKIYTTEKEAALAAFASLPEEERRVKLQEFEDIFDQKFQAFQKSLVEQAEQIVADPLTHADQEYEQLLKSCVEPSPINDPTLVKV